MVHSMPMRAKQPLLFIFGAGDAADQVAQSATRTHVKGSTDLGRLLPDSVVRHRLIVSPDSFRRSLLPDLANYPVIANLITEAEHNRITLEMLGGWLGKASGRIVNVPQAVLRSTRDQVAERLAGIDGLIAPKTIRLHGDQPEDAARVLDGEGMQSIILRQSGTHGGAIIGRFETIQSLTAALQPGTEYIATQFVDFRSNDGLYRKHRVFFIGPHRVLRHKLIADSWSVHGRTRVELMAKRPELIAEERAMFESDRPFIPSVERVLATVRDRMGLDFFGMDFGVTEDDRLVLFEANATMSFMQNLSVPGFEYLRRCYAPAQAAFMELLGVTH